MKAKRLKVRVPKGFEARPRDNRFHLFKLNGKKLYSNGKPMWDRTYIRSFTADALKWFYEREQARGSTLCHSMK
jgi:hypothetical protein